MLPNSAAALGGSLTDRDKREIARTCRWHTAKFAVEKLRHGEFGWFGYSLRVLFQQKINRFIDDHDGTYRAYVVVYNPTDPDGYVPWYRHQLVRTNGSWMILRSY